MIQRAGLIGVLMVLCAGCGENPETTAFAPVATADASEPPAFLQEGKRYLLATGMAGTTVLVLEIDSKAGWIKVSDEKGDEYWYNLSSVLALREIK